LPVPEQTAVISRAADGSPEPGAARLFAGPSAKVPRWYDWVLIEASDSAVTDGDGPRWLLVRRRISDGEYGFYRARP
jgi:hypothetical protein